MGLNRPGQRASSCHTAKMNGLTPGYDRRLQSNTPPQGKDGSVISRHLRDCLCTAPIESRRIRCVSCGNCSGRGSPPNTSATSKSGVAVTVHQTRLRSRYFAIVCQKTRVPREKRASTGQIAIRPTRGRRER